jgi:hypothetical protein
MLVTKMQLKYEGNSNKLQLLCPNETICLQAKDQRKKCTSLQVNQQSSLHFTVREKTKRRNPKYLEKYSRVELKFF